MKLSLSAILIAASVAAMAGSQTPRDATPAKAPIGRIPVLLELFTSEGCSSCPPADRLLESLDRQPVANADLIVLSEHVDYWNHLGWSDPYSSAFFSARQSRYSERLASSVYTPQMVIDGRIQALGSDAGEVKQAIAEAMKSAPLPVSVSASRSGAGGALLHVDATSGGANTELYVAVAMDHARSQVLKGENSGHMLTHVAVARAIVKIGRWEDSGRAGKDIQIPSKQLPASLLSAQSGETRIIVFLQDAQSGRILGAAQTRL